MKTTLEKGHTEMKIKQLVIITDPLKFAGGDYSDCMTLLENDPGVKDWICCGEIDVAIDIDQQTVVNISLAALEREADRVRQELKAKLELLERKKSELLCLSHDSQ